MCVCVCVYLYTIGELGHSQNDEIFNVQGYCNPNIKNLFAIDDDYSLESFCTTGLS